MRKKKRRRNIYLLNNGGIKSIDARLAQNYITPVSTGHEMTREEINTAVEKLGALARADESTCFVILNPFALEIEGRVADGQCACLEAARFICVM